MFEKAGFTDEVKPLFYFPHICNVEIMNRIEVLLVFILCAYGCSTQYTVTGKPQAKFSLDRLNKAINDRTVSIVLRNDEAFTGEKVNVRVDSCIWFDGYTKSIRGILTKDISKITFIDRHHGAGDGLMMGIFGGATVAYLSLAAGQWSDDILGITGIMAFTGIIIGSGIGHRVEYDFPENEFSNP